MTSYLIGTFVQLITNGVKLSTYRPDDSDEELDIRARAWEVAVKRSKDGSDEPFKVVGWDQATEDHAVAKEVLGRGKLIDSSVPDKAGEILRQYREEPEALVAYNLEDARLVPEILEKEGLLELCIERSLLSGMPLDRVSASGVRFARALAPAC